MRLLNDPKQKYYQKTKWNTCTWWAILFEASLLGYYERKLKENTGSQEQIDITTPLPCCVLWPHYFALLLVFLAIHIQLRFSIISSNVHLEINVTRGWHYDDVFPFFSEGQGTVPDLAAGHQEVVLRTQHILAQVVDPYKVGGNNRDFRLWTCNDMRKYSGDPKSDPLKTGKFWKPDVWKVIFCSAFRRVGTIAKL